MPQGTLKALVVATALVPALAMAGKPRSRREPPPPSNPVLRTPAMQPNVPAAAGSEPDVSALVSGVSIQSGEGGGVRIDVTTTRSVPYHCFTLENPSRLVVDLPGTREGLRRQVFPTDSNLLKRVRVGQWKAGYPSIVRVVADLNGHPHFQVTPRPSGVQIVLEPALRKTAGGYNFSGRKSAAAIATGSGGGGSRSAAQKSQGPRSGGVRIGAAAGAKGRFRAAAASIYPRPTAGRGTKSRLRSGHVAPKTARFAAPFRPVRGHSALAFKAAERPAEEESPHPLATVSKIAIHPDRDGKTLVDVATTRSIPYHFFQLGRPPRLVVDLNDARRGLLPYAYPVHSLVLRQVRVGQWKSGAPAVVRVVADLEGWPAFHVHPDPPGIQIDLTPRQFVPAPIRNPFAYFSPRPAVRRYRAAVAIRKAPPPSATPEAPATPPPDLSYLGYVLIQGSQVEAIISDPLEVRMVRQGDTIDDRYQILLITSRAVEISDLKNNQLFWLKVNPPN